MNDADTVRALGGEPIDGWSREQLTRYKEISRFMRLLNVSLVLSHHGNLPDQHVPTHCPHFCSLLYRSGGLSPLLQSYCQIPRAEACSFDSLVRILLRCDEEGSIQLGDWQNARKIW